MFRASSQDERASMMAMAICAPQNADKAMAALDDELASWVSEGITEEELQEAKTSYELKFKSRLAGEGYLLNQLLRGLELDRTLQFQQDLVDRVMQVTTQDVRDSVGSILGDAPMVSVVAGDPEPRAEAEEQSTENDQRCGQLNAGIGWHLGKDGREAHAKSDTRPLGTDQAIRQERGWKGRAERITRTGTTILYEDGR